jgi:hypothetical protein
LHTSQLALQAVSQHTPSAQPLPVHWRARSHAAPFACAATHAPALHQ